MKAGGFERFLADRRATSSTIAAGAAFALLGAAAMATDTSSFYVQKRRLQSVVDLAALAAAANPTSADTLAQATFAANNLTPKSIAVSLGAYDPTQQLGSRFVANVPVTNAARVTATISPPLLLARVFGGGTAVVLSASGTASAEPSAAFDLGSRLASLDGGVANLVLSSLLGSKVSLSALDYNALASTNVDLGAFLGALAASTGGSGGTYASVLGSNISASQALSALLASNATGSATAGLTSLVNSLPSPGGPISLSGLISLGTSGNLPVGSTLPAATTMNAFALVSGIAQLAATGRPMTIDLSSAVPGLLGASLTVTLGPNGPVSAIAPFATTTTAATGQMLIALTTSVNVVGLGTVSLPLGVSVARAQATTQGPTCNAGVPSVSLAVQPAALTVLVGSTPASPPVASILGAALYASGSASSANASPTTETFGPEEVRNGTVKTATSGSNVASLAASALANATLSFSRNGTPATLLPGVRATVMSGLGSLAMPSASLLDSVARTLGVGLGQADTWVTGLTCGSPALVE